MTLLPASAATLIALLTFHLVCAQNSDDQPASLPSSAAAPGPPTTFEPTGLTARGSTDRATDPAPRAGNPDGGCELCHGPGTFATPGGLPGKECHWTVELGFPPHDVRWGKTAPDVPARVSLNPVQYIISGGCQPWHLAG